MRLNPIAARFNAAASSYATATTIQYEAARALAAAVIAADLPRGARVAEFGCGTGHLTERLLDRLQPAHWLATDIAPAMLEALSLRLGHPALTVARLDASDPGLEPGFDMVCSGLTLQWLADPALAARRWRALVRPGGLLAVSTLVEGSFAEWRTALARAGAAAPGPAFPTPEALRSWFGPAAELGLITLVDRHANGLAFARAARAAGIDASRIRAIGAGAMRRALRAFEADGAAVTYKLAVVLDRVTGD